VHIYNYVLLILPEKVLVEELGNT